MMSNQKVIIGIDVSEHNGTIDWEKVKASEKVGFAMIRAGYGKGVVDRKFLYNAEECNRLKIPIGIYWFSYAKSAEEAEREAQYCINSIHDIKIDYPVCFDFEDYSVANCKRAGIVIKDKTFATMLAINFLNVIKKAGYTPANYTNPAYINQYFDQSRLSMYDLWLAQWPENPNPEKRPIQSPNIWQYSSNGNVPGIYTKVDMDVCYTPYVKTNDVSMSGSTTAPSFMTQTWAQEAVKKAKEYGISDGSRPDAPATRVEVMAMITRAIDYMTKTTISEQLASNDDRK